MTVNNETMVRLFNGHIENATDRGEPEWTGTFFEFWTENDDAYSLDEIETMLNDMDRVGETYIGGGAQPAFTLTLA